MDGLRSAPCPKERTSPMHTRRDFIKSALAGGALALGSASASPLLLQALGAARASSRTLVVLELAGGNDGLNTVVPYKDPLYRRLRPAIGVAEREVLPLERGLGLHPRMRGLAGLYEKGRLAVVQGVGYP